MKEIWMEESQENEKYSCLRKVWRIIWSIRVITVLSLSTFVLIVAFTIWAINAFATFFSTSNVIEKARKTAVENILAGTSNIFDQVRGSISTIDEVLLYSHIRGVNYSQNFTNFEDDFTLALHSQLKAYPSLSEIFLGTTQGEFIGTVKLNIDSIMRIVTRKGMFNGFDTPITYVNRYLLDYKTSLIIEDLGIDFTSLGFDPRKRSWYLNESTQGIKWIKVYKSLGEEENLVLGCSKVFKDQNSKPWGVIGISINLDSLVNYLHHLDFISFILENDGIVIASSLQLEEELVIHKGHESNNSIVREVSNYLRLNFGSYCNVTKTEHQIFDSKENLLFFEIEIIKVFGIQLIVVVVVNYFEEYFFSFISIIFSILATFLFILFIVFITLIISISTSSFLHFQASKMKKISKLQFPKRNISKTTKNLYPVEFRKMELAMEKMVEALQIFSQFLPQNVLQRILNKNKIELDLNHSSETVRSRNISVLFVDLEHFTTIAEKNDPLVTLRLLERFFNDMEKIIIKHHGVVDKFVGDCVMAIFSAFGEYSTEHPFQACLCAIEMKKKAEKIKFNSKSLKVRIGINSGFCLVGVMGSFSRKQFTTVGDVTNVASRLEQLNKEFGTRIMCGENTFVKVQDRIECKFLGNVKIRGKSEKLNVYEVITFEDTNKFHICLTPSKKVKRIIKIPEKI